MVALRIFVCQAPVRILRRSVLDQAKTTNDLSPARIQRAGVPIRLSLAAKKFSDPGSIADLKHNLAEIIIPEQNAGLPLANRTEREETLFKKFELRKRSRSVTSQPCVPNSTS